MSEISNQQHGRRTILAGAGAALGLGALAAAVPGQVLPADDTIPRILPVHANSADAELIVLCEQFSVLQARINDHWAHGIGDELWHGPTYIEDDDEREEADAPLERLQRPIMARIGDLSPKTLEGCRALARAAALWDCELRGVVEFGDNSDSKDYSERLVAALVRGLTDGLATVGGIS